MTPAEQNRIRSLVDDIMGMVAVKSMVAGDLSLNVLLSVAISCAVTAVAHSADPGNTLLTHVQGLADQLRRHGIAVEMPAAPHAAHAGRPH